MKQVIRLFTPEVVKAHRTTEYPIALQDILVGELYADHTTSFLSEWAKVHPVKDNLFAYTPAGLKLKHLIRDSNTIAFDVDMTPTAYKYIESGYGHSYLTYNDRDDYHLQGSTYGGDDIDVGIKRVTDTKVPVGVQTNQQFHVLYCNISPEDEMYVDHIECCYKYMVREGGEFCFISDRDFIYDNPTGNAQNHFLRMLYSWGDFTSSNYSDRSFAGFKTVLREKKYLMLPRMKIARLNASDKYYAVWLKKDRSF